ncbi:MAG: hypothetical protein QME51_03735 [Planctomycetota bacterium]|nr:hypothetical protein [Planctomycetota bacterium]
MHSKGITLVLVLVMLASLILLGIPFTLSMLYKEKGSKDILHQTHSRFSALGARNSAINLLLRSHTWYELQSGLSPFDTPDYDTSGEFETNLTQLGISNISNPKGIIWSAYAEDEQGKINILSAPRRLIEQLRSILKPTDDISHHITEYSYRSTPWVGAQNLAGFSLYTAKDDNDYHILHLENYVPWGLEEGARVRLQQGIEETIAYVAFEPCPMCRNISDFPDTINDIPGNHLDWVVTPTSTTIWRSINPPLKNLYLDRLISDTFLTETTIVEVEQPHSVNINTCSKEVLTALMIGVGRQIYVPPDTTLTPDQAQSLADELRKKTFTCPPDLEDTVFNSSVFTSDKQRQDFWMNVFYPRDTSLANMVDRKFTGTLPFCYRSFDIYTINSTGVINYPSGSQATLSTIREIIDIAPIGTLTWGLESQYDFDKEFYVYSGNPEKLTTYPTFTNLGGRDKTTAGKTPDLSRVKSVGSLKLRTAEDLRGKNVIRRDSFSDTYDGVQTPLSYNRDDIFFFIPDDTRFDIRAGGIEFWIRFDSIPASAELFNIQQQEFENRISLTYENNGLILMVCDATVERKSAQIRASLAFETDVWYHITTFWHGTKYPYLALFVDGKPVGSFAHYDNGSGVASTELTMDIPDGWDDSSTDQQEISVGTTQGFPSGGVIEIGSEVIEYWEKTGNTFVIPNIWDRTVTPSVLAYTGRGKRGSGALAHPGGAKVCIYGYSTPFVSSYTIAGYPPVSVNPLPIGGATLQAEIPASWANMVINQGIGEISPLDTTIEIFCDAISDIPAQGYIRIENEVIYYDSVGTDRLLGCIRGQLGTIPRRHINGREIYVYSIKVSNTANYPSPVLIQIDDEWFGPVQRIADTTWFTGIPTVATRYLPRGYVSGGQQHNTGAAVIPVLAVQNSRAGRNDIVTIVEQDQTTNPKEQRVVRNVWGNLVGFDSFLTRNYNVDTITRILKFPSDELPSYLPGSATIGSNIQGRVDEVKFYSSGRNVYRTNEVVLSGEVGRTRVRLTNALPNSSGLVKIGDEYIGYASRSGVEIRDCIRGYLNSGLQTHDTQERLFDLTTFLPVTDLISDITDTSNVIQVTNSSGFANSGYVLIGNAIDTAEVSAYCARQGRNLVMPSHSDGIFRGSFGTTKQPHSRNTLVYAIPFRYWDLQKENSFDSEMAYFQAAHSVRNATWEKINWEETHTPSNDGMIRLRVLMRFDNQPAWNEVPTNSQGGIFQFTDPAAANDLNIKADQMEVMVFFQYMPGAFLSNGWKRSPYLENLYLDYKKPMVILSRQEK